PSAVDELRHRGVTISRRNSEVGAQTGPGWLVALERPYAIVKSVLPGLLREVTWEGPCELAERVARRDCCGAVAFCEDPSLVCCVANKVSGLRAAPVVNVAQVARARWANLLAVEMPGRTFFEVRQILRNL